MIDKDKPKFANLMKVIAETYGNTPPSKERIEIYFRVLSDYSIKQVDDAVVNLLRTRTTTTTFPVPGEIIQAMESGGQSSALIALDKAERAVEKYGSYSAVIFDDPIIHMVIANMGGWPRFCAPSIYGDDREWHWIQKDFVRLYETFSKSQRAEFPSVLIGLSDTSYVRNGETFVVPPKIVGDQKKALEWTENRKQVQIESSPVKRLV